MPKRLRPHSAKRRRQIFRCIVNVVPTDASIDIDVKPHHSNTRVLNAGIQREVEKG